MRETKTKTILFTILLFSAAVTATLHSDTVHSDTVSSISTGLTVQFGYGILEKPFKTALHFVHGKYKIFKNFPYGVGSQYIIQYGDLKSFYQSTSWDISLSEAFGEEKTGIRYTTINSEPTYRDGGRPQSVRVDWGKRNWKLNEYESIKNNTYKTVTAKKEELCFYDPKRPKEKYCAPQVGSDETHDYYLGRTGVNGDSIRGHYNKIHKHYTFVIHYSWLSEILSFPDFGKSGLRIIAPIVQSSVPVDETVIFQKCDSAADKSIASDSTVESIKLRVVGGGVRAINFDVKHVFTRNDGAFRIYQKQSRHGQEYAFKRNNLVTLFSFQFFNWYIFETTKNGSKGIGYETGSSSGKFDKAPFSAQFDWDNSAGAAAVVGLTKTKRRSVEKGSDHLCFYATDRPDRIYNVYLDSSNDDYDFYNHLQSVDNYASIRGHFTKSTKQYTFALNLFTYAELVSFTDESNGGDIIGKGVRSIVEGAAPKAFSSTSVVFKQCKK